MSYEPIEIVGLKEALKELNTIDKRVRRQITRSYTKIMEPAIIEAKSLVPTEPPLRGMGHKWNPSHARAVRNGNEVQASEAQDDLKRQLLPWHPASNKGIKAFTSGKTPREFRGMRQNATTFGMKWVSRQAALYELAAKGNLGGKMTAKHGPAPRVMWKAYENNKNVINKEVRELVKYVMAAVGKNIK